MLRDLQLHERQYYDRTRPPEDMGAWYIALLQREVAESAGHLLVAERDGRIAGYASLFAVVSSEEHKDEIPHTYALVGDLGVLAPLRGQGIGEALMLECERLARAAGQKWLRLGVLARNEAARRFYARAGFAEVLLTLEKTL